MRLKSGAQPFVPVRKQPHPSRTQDVERRFFVFALWDVSSSEAEEGLQVVTGLSGDVCQGRDTWEKNIYNHQQRRAGIQLQ